MGALAPRELPAVLPRVPATSSFSVVVVSLQKLSGSFAALRDPAGKVTDPESWGGLRQGRGFS